MSKIFDSHCHPQFPQYDSDRGEMLKRAREAGVHMICVGTDFETSKLGIELAEKNENIWATIGAHPTDAVNEKNNLSDYEKLLAHPKVVAIGEIGLDYYRTPELEKQKIQKEIFQKFLELAVRYEKAVVIHSRDSGKGSIGRVHSDLLEIIKNFSVKGVAHSFTGTLEESKKYLELGFSLGFNGIITFAKQYDDVVIHTPLEQMLIETDAPYLTPEPFRGQRNEPAYVIKVAKRIAELKKLSLEEVVEVTSANCLKLFKIGT